MAYKTTWLDNGVIWTFKGSLTDEDLIKSNEDIYHDPRFKDLKYQICDFSEVTSFPIKSATIRKVAYMDFEAYKINPNIKVAIVADKEVVIGLSNMYSTYLDIASDNESWETENFLTLDEAKQWVRA